LWEDGFRPFLKKMGGALFSTDIVQSVLKRLLGVPGG
jgi:hypothetical protein